MSLWIDVDQVTDVLLADGWHVVDDKSFDLDSYDFHSHGTALPPGGEVHEVPSTGFSFLTQIDGMQTVLIGPLTSVLAVRQKRA